MITRLFFMLQLTTMCSHWQEKKPQLDRDVRTDNAHTGTQNTHGGIARWACAYYTWAHMWCFKAMSVFQKSTCKSWQNCLRIWNQSCACNWFWCLSTRSASKWGQEAHVNTDNATKIFSAQVLPATHTAFIRCYTTRLHIMATRLCQCTCMCGYYNANERLGFKDMISGVHYRCFCQPRSVPLSALAGSAQPIAGLCHLHAGHSENISFTLHA